MINNCFSALGWTPEGQRVRQSSKTTWRRTVDRKRNKAGESWEVAKVVEWDRKCWSESVMTLYTPTGTTRSDDGDETLGCKNTHENSSVNCFAPCSEDSNDLSFSVALATFLTQSCPVVPRDAVTTSMYLVKSSLAKTGALEATAPVND